MVQITIDENNSKVIEQLQLNIQEIMLLKSLEEYYSDSHNFDILNSIIDNTNILSKRIIEYFVTKYSNIENVCYLIEEKDKKKIKLNVYSSYKDQLKSHKKRYFDPFGRGDRIPFFTNNTCVITTIGQLNFYRWFISKKIYNYCLDNHKTIQNSLMNNFTKKRKSTNNKKKYTNYLKQNVKPQYNAPMNLSVSFDI